ncbi:hypothetical protein GOP47_0005858 [Adiantum capillus-veneris]|uniref:Uncharacterized protein n=1 Tax=Adiantum capillus-veneris TaxID=13818 RepID=A0A9D4ZLZ8_ADICA|nr:hypothetical protein GOP47_0005858 [Adiantum capillus-veneris]
MMFSQLGPVGIVLSVVFVLFMAVLVLELCYVWWSRQRRLQEAREGRGSTTAMRRLAMKRTWPNIVCACRGSGEAEEEEGEDSKRWQKLFWWWRSTAVEVSKMGCSDAMEEEGKVGRLARQGEAQEEEEEEEGEDVMRMGPWGGPPRLLFTIKEETKEEMELEEVRCKASHVSSASVEIEQQQLFSSTSTCNSVVASSCTSPFLTPPSSPPFATPFGSPAPNNAYALGQLVIAVEVDSTSSSTSSSSPLLQGRRPLSLLCDDTSSFSPSSLASTPAALSPSSAGAPPSVCSSPTTNKKRHPLCLLLDPPPSPSSTLYHYHLNRVYPLTQDPCNVDGKPLLPFHIPAPSQPTTPCPFRPSLLAKGGVASPPLSTLHSRISNRL